MRIAHAIRPFLRSLPFQMGKGKLAHYLLQPAEIPSVYVRTKSGVMVRTLQDKIYRDIYLYGEYEHNLTTHIQKIVKPGFTCLDIGANFGYYSVLLAKLTKGRGLVHAFEPLPLIYELTQETVRENGVEENVVLNNCGLGTRRGEFTVYSFNELPQGHASSNDLGRSDSVPHRCTVITLDQYADEHGVKTVDFIKVDVEGDELCALKGGERLLRRSSASVSFEINLNCLQARSVAVEEVEGFLRCCGYHTFLQFRSHRAAQRVSHLEPRISSDYVALKAA